MSASEDYRPTQQHDLAEPSALKQRFDAVFHTASDINEHLLRLYQLAGQCKHVTEFGTREGNSTVAFLFAQPETLVCYDTDHKEWVTELLRTLAGQTAIEFNHSDVLHVEIAPTDLLFIDTQHTYAQLSQELALHADKSRHWIVLHDTTTFGQTGEDGGKGLWPAVQEFLAAQPQWKLAERHENNNGLTVLERDNGG